MEDFKLVCMAPDGDYVVDEVGTKKECEEASADMGSRWIFYPIHLIIKDKGTVVEDNQRVIEGPDMFPSFKNKSFKKVREYVKSLPEEFWNA